MSEATATIEAQNRATPSDLYKRREHYAESNGQIILPNGVLVLTAGATVNRNHIKAEILGSGMGGETWGIGYKEFTGDTDRPELYEEFDYWLRQRFRHESGHKLFTACVCMDAGFKTEAVSRYVRSCSQQASTTARKTFAAKAIRGFAYASVQAPIEDKPLCWVKVDGIKASVYSRLEIDEPGLGYQHFPSNPQCGYDEEYFRQLKSETLRNFSNGRHFVLSIPGIADHALDCRVLAEAAVEILSPDWDKVMASLERPK